MKYWLGPNTLGGMQGCPIHLSFNIGVPHSKMGIILLMRSQVFGGCTPIAPGSILQSNMSHAVDRQSLCLPSLNTQINSSKAVVQVQIWPSLLLNMGVVLHVTLTWYLGNELENTHGHDVVSSCCPLVLAFGIQAIEYEFDFDLLSGVAVNQIVPLSRDNISILSLEFFTSKMKSLVLMPIVFVDKGQTPIRTISFSLIPFL